LAIPALVVTVEALAVTVEASAGTVEALVGTAVAVVGTAVVAAIAEPRSLGFSVTQALRSVLVARSRLVSIRRDLENPWFTCPTW
jgi:hypothetical protein